MSTPDFRRAVRGYDTDDVSRYVAELSERNEPNRIGFACYRWGHCYSWDLV